MFRKIIDSVYDVMVGFREHPLLLCLFIFPIFSGVVYAVSCATETKTVVDKEYIDGYGYSHHSYEIRVCTETYFEEHFNVLKVHGRQCDDGQRKYDDTLSAGRG